MVAVPKIVLKSQTRMTLNERFTQYSEQQQARVQMFKNDLHTRITEDAFRRNGGPDTAELSRKLDNLQRVIENQLRRKSPSPQDARRASRYSPSPPSAQHSRPTTYGHYAEAHGESLIVPEYRSLLYHSGSSNTTTGATSNRYNQYGSTMPRKSRYDLTYGDVIEGHHHRDYDAPSSSMYADNIANDRLPASRRLDARANISSQHHHHHSSSTSLNRSGQLSSSTYGGASYSQPHHQLPPSLHDTYRYSRASAATAEVGYGRPSATNNVVGAGRRAPNMSGAGPYHRLPAPVGANGAGGGAPLLRRQRNSPKDSHPYYYGSVADATGGGAVSSSQSGRLRAARRKYDNPLMRDSESEEDDEDRAAAAAAAARLLDDRLGLDWEDALVGSGEVVPNSVARYGTRFRRAPRGTTRRTAAAAGVAALTKARGKSVGGGIKSRLGVRARPQFKKAPVAANGTVKIGAKARKIATVNGIASKALTARGGRRKGAANRLATAVKETGALASGKKALRNRLYSRALSKAKRGAAGAAARKSKAQARPAVTKEQLDKELEEYHKKKGLSKETTANASNALNTDAAMIVDN